LGPILRKAKKIVEERHGQSVPYSESGNVVREEYGFARQLMWEEGWDPDDVARSNVGVCDEQVALSNKVALTVAARESL